MVVSINSPNVNLKLVRHTPDPLSHISAVYWVPYHTYWYYTIPKKHAFLFTKITKKTLDKELSTSNFLPTQTHFLAKFYTTCFTSASFSYSQLNPSFAFLVRPAFITLHKVGATAPATTAWRSLRRPLYLPCPFPALASLCGCPPSIPLSTFVFFFSFSSLRRRCDENWFFVTPTTTEPIRMARRALARVRSGPIDQWMARTC